MSLEAAIRKLTEAVEILLEHADSMSVPMSPREVVIAQALTSEALVAEVRRLEGRTHNLEQALERIAAYESTEAAGLGRIARAALAASGEEPA